MHTNLQPFSDGILVYFLGVALLASVVKLLFGQRIKDFFGRFAVNLRAECKLDEQIYFCYRNLDIISNGRHEQADQVYVSPFGIFVVNTPNHQGRIWGGKGQFWQQKIHRKTIEFPNPLLQNQHHINALSERLSLPKEIFCSLVVFPKYCRFQTMMPDNVIEVSDFVQYVSQYDTPVLDEEQIAQVKAALEVSEFDAVFDAPSIFKQIYGFCL